MKKRAELEQLTRRRITESTVELHRTLGPAATSISAVAEHAGVRRSTVYRHFPDEASLFAACSGHWTTMHPPPDVTRWAEIAGPDERLRTALGEIYAHYRRTEQMLEKVLRDAALMPALDATLDPLRQYMEAARDTLMAGRGLRGRARADTSAAIGHALAFTTWRSLARDQGLTDERAAGLMCGLVANARSVPLRK